MTRAPLRLPDVSGADGVARTSTGRQTSPPRLSPPQRTASVSRGDIGVTTGIAGFSAATAIGLPGYAPVLWLAAGFWAALAITLARAMRRRR